MNKGLELIEAHHLFGVPYERIDVVVHPQSLIHSLVTLVDGATLAHLGHPDMRVPISYALHGPERIDAARRAARPRRRRRAHLRGARHRDVPLPAPRPRGRRGGRDGAVRAQRRQRGRRRRVPRGRDPLHRHPRRSSSACSRRCRRRAPTHFADLFDCDAEARPGAGDAAVASGTWPRQREARDELVPRLRAASRCSSSSTRPATSPPPRPSACGSSGSSSSSRPSSVSIKRGETEYGIGAIPLGGFVKITGMNPEEEIPQEVAAPRLLPPAGLEADLRDRRGAVREHRPRAFVFFFLAVGFGLDTGPTNTVGTVRQRLPAPGSSSRATRSSPSTASASTASRASSWPTRSASRSPPTAARVSRPTAASPRPRGPEGPPRRRAADGAHQARLLDAGGAAGPGPGRAANGDRLRLRGRPRDRSRRARPPASRSTGSGTSRRRPPPSSPASSTPRSAIRSRASSAPPR